MLPTIVFFTALLFSIVYLFNAVSHLLYFTKLNSKEKGDQSIELHILIFLIAILWSWLYWLSH